MGELVWERQPHSALGKCGGAGHNGMGVGELALSLLDGNEDEGELAQRAWTWAKAGSAPHLARAGAGLIVWMQEGWQADQLNWAHTDPGL